MCAAECLVTGRKRIAAVSGHFDLADANSRVQLAMSSLSAIVLSPPQFLNGVLLTERHTHNVCDDARTLDNRTTESQPVTARDRQDPIQLQLLTSGEISIVQVDLLTVLDFVLPTSVDDNRVHFWFPFGGFVEETRPSRVHAGARRISQSAASSWTDWEIHPTPIDRVIC